MTGQGTHVILRLPALWVSVPVLRRYLMLQNNASHVTKQNPPPACLPGELLPGLLVAQK